MSYSLVATGSTPALVIYLLDMSASMANADNQISRIEAVNDALYKTILRMLQRSKKGSVFSPRYRVAILAYNDRVFDLLDGIQSISKFLELGIPQLVPRGKTNTGLAFTYVEELLRSELINLQNCPVPVICHMTDGEYTDEDPEPIAQQIMQIAVPDGNILVENIFVDESILVEPVGDIYHWKGVTDENQLATPYAKKLFRMSSIIPPSYRDVLVAMGYEVFSSNARMMIPASDHELMSFGFVMSGATPISGRI